MIQGCGVDLVEVKRFKTALKSGQAFMRRIFTKEELAYCKKKRMSPQHLAARFAAKEAVAKAFGNRQNLAMQWKDVWVENSKDGQPHVKLAGDAKKLNNRYKVKRIHLSLTHTDQFAIAMAVLEK